MNFTQSNSLKQMHISNTNNILLPNVMAMFGYQRYLELTKTQRICD